MSETEKKGGGKKRLVVIMAAVAIVGGAGAGAWFTGMIGHGGHHAKAVVAAPEVPTLVDLPDMISNLDTGGRRASFVKLHVKIQVNHAADVVAIRTAEPELVDIVQTYLREMRPDELRGGEGVYRLREALMNRLDGRLAPIQVTDLLFTQLLVQ